ncbi:MAG: family 43 glycosylhydrolase, partial [Luteolibacter sp.]
MKPFIPRKLKKTLGIAILSFTAFHLNAAPALAPWVSDQGDGTYKNPVLYSDYSDPDAVRVGDDYYMTASSFNHAPGLPILHSKDMINWTIINHALPVIPPKETYQKVLHGLGVYAPSIRYHDGTFFIFYGDPDFGIYMVSTKDPRGKWTEPLLIKEGPGYIDTCPLWDDDDVAGAFLDEQGLGPLSAGIFCG